MAPRKRTTAAAARARRSEAGRKAAVTRSARLRGVDPARAWAAKKGWDTRRRTAEHKAREHGKQAREATERRLTPAQRAARTRDARRIKAATEARERPVTKGRRILHSIDDFDDYHPHDDDQEYEVEGHQDGAYSDEE